MTRTPSCLARAVLTGVLLAGLVGCGDSSGDPGASPTTPTAATSTGQSSPTPPTSSSGGSSSPAGPTVTPATGIQLTEASSTVTAPDGWTLMPEIIDYASSASKPGGLSSLQLVDSGDISGGASLDSLAQSTIDTLPKGAKATRLPDDELDGAAFLHIHYTVPGDPKEYDSLTTVRKGRNVGLDFVLLKKDTATNPDLIASVLATFRWIA